jgi:hypothetical protein
VTPAEPTTGPDRRRLHWPRVTRDLVLFVTGLVFATHEVFVTRLDRPGVLVLAAGCLGLPAFLRADERNRGI